MLCFCSLHLLPVVPDQVLLPGDLHFKDCCFSHTLTPGLANAGLRHIFSRVGKLHFLYEVQLFSLSMFEILEKARAVLDFPFPPEASSSVWYESSAASGSNIWEYIQRHTHWPGLVFFCFLFFLIFALTANPADAERGKWVRGEGNTFPIKDPRSPLQRWDSNNQGSFWMFQHHSPNTHTHTL